MIRLLQNYKDMFRPPVPFDPEKDKLYPFDFTKRNKEISIQQISDTESLSKYIQGKLIQHNCKYGIGGYQELRTLYDHTKLFDSEDEPRRLHLGTDIWGMAGTGVMSPLDGLVHSFAFNKQIGDYGATIILTHYLAGFSFHTLYGHLSLNSLKNLQPGIRVKRGEVFSEFGMRFENGNWPAHLHFQIIFNLEGWEGDYPGVCKYSEKEQWLSNCPDPEFILQMKKYISA